MINRCIYHHIILLDARNTTERQELISNFCGVMVNQDFNIKVLDHFFSNISLFKKNKNLYGKGDSCEKILKVLKKSNIY